MCIPEGTGNVTVQLKSFTDACMCPSSYVWLDMVISKTNPNTMTNGVSWKLESGDTNGIVTLQQTDPNTRSGVYYLNILGTCNSVCLDMCNCGPCSNLANSKYGLLVTSRVNFENNQYYTDIGSCEVHGVIGGVNGYCSDACPVTALGGHRGYGKGLIISGDSGEVSSIQTLNSGIVAGITMLVFIVIILMVFGWRNRNRLFRQVSYLRFLNVCYNSRNTKVSNYYKMCNFTVIWGVRYYQFTTTYSSLWHLSTSIKFLLQDPRSKFLFADPEGSNDDANSDIRYTPSNDSTPWYCTVL